MPQSQDLARIAEFNRPENVFGNIIKVIVLDTKTAGEGVSLRAVRHIVLIDVPDRWGYYEQWVGRGSRMGGHHVLPGPEQDCTVHILKALIPPQSRLSFFHALGLPREL